VAGAGGGTEAGAVGTFAVLLLAVGKRDMSFEKYVKSLKESLRTAIMILMLIVFVGAIRKWLELLQVKTTVTDEYGERVLEIVPE